MFSVWVMGSDGAVFSLHQGVKKAQITSVAHICIHVNSFAGYKGAHI